MATQSVSLAKTTRPSLTGVIPRDRLFQRLDAALGSSAIWVTGPPGCGKTTLAASYLEHRKPASLWYQFDEGDADVASFFYYLGLAAAEPGKRRPGTLPQLTPEHHTGLPAFTRRYFQALYQRLGPSFALVFDGYHDVPAQSALHEVMRIALSEVPPGGAVVIISRSDPPPAMARLRANRAMEVIGWRELRLTQEESNALVARRGRSLAPDALVELYGRTQGWAAGLILMLEQPPAYDALAATPDLANPGLVFDYLAVETFLSSAVLIPAGTPGQESSDVPAGLVVEAGLRFHDLKSGTSQELSTAWRAEPRTLREWADNDGALLRETLGKGCDALANQLLIEAKPVWLGLRR